MALPTHINKSDLRSRLERRAAYLTVPKAIAVHAWPARSKGEHWYGIGPCAWGEEAVSWFDIRLATDEAFQAVNSLLADVCQELHIPYINMA